MQITLSDFNNTQSIYALQYNISICINGVDKTQNDPQTDFLSGSECS